MNTEASYNYYVDSIYWIGFNQARRQELRDVYEDVKDTVLRLRQDDAVQFEARFRVLLDAWNADIANGDNIGPEFSTAVDEYWSEVRDENQVDPFDDENEDLEAGWMVESAARDLLISAYPRYARYIVGTYQ